jgi:hypothetical protein
MSLAAVPIYLLARRLVRPGLALLAAALSLAIPSMFYSSLIMTESAFYTVFAFFALALVLALERPAPARQLAVVALVVLAYYTRTQAVLLGPATLTATVLLAAAESRRGAPGARLREFGRELYRFRLTWLVLVGGAVAVVVAQLARGHSFGDLFGAYESVISADYSAGSVARWFLYDFIGLDLAFAVVPVAALLLVAGSAFRRGMPRSYRAFSAGAVALLFWFLLVVAMFQAGSSPRLEERLLFHLAPLLFVGLVAWIDGWRLDDWRLRAAAALVACTLPLAFPFGDLLRWDMVSDSFGLWPLNHLRESGFSVGEIVIVVTLGVLACGLAFVLLRGWWRLVVPGLLLVMLAVSSVHVHDRVSFFSLSSLQAGTGSEREWIDDAVGLDADVVSLWSLANRSADWQNEFFNRSLGRSYYVSYANDGLPSDALTVGEGGTLLGADGQAVEADYAVTGLAYRLEGTPVASDPAIGTTVYRVDGPLRLREYVGNLFPDRYSSRTLDYIRYGCSGGELRVALTQNALLIDVPQTVVASVDEREVARTVVEPTAVDQPLAVPLVADSAGACSVTFRVTPTAVPDDVLGNGDRRALGVQFTKLEYVPAP